MSEPLVPPEMRWCRTCKFDSRDPTEEPCYSCLAHPGDEFPGWELSDEERLRLAAPALAEERR